MATDQSTILMEIAARMGFIPIRGENLRNQIFDELSSYNSFQLMSFMELSSALELETMNELISDIDYDYIDKDRLAIAISRELERRMETVDGEKDLRKMEVMDLERLPVAQIKEWASEYMDEYTELYKMVDDLSHKLELTMTTQDVFGNLLNDSICPRERITLAVDNIVADEDGIATIDSYPLVYLYFCYRLHHIENKKAADIIAELEYLLPTLEDKFGSTMSQLSTQFPISGRRFNKSQQQIFFQQMLQDHRSFMSSKEEYLDYIKDFLQERLEREDRYHQYFVDSRKILRTFAYRNQRRYLDNDVQAPADYKDTNRYLYNLVYHNIDLLSQNEFIDSLALASGVEFSERTREEVIDRIAQGYIMAKN